jgi:hypothetical protein
MFRKLLNALNIRRGERVVLPKVQIAQTSKENAKHIPRPKSANHPPKAFQAKRQLQKIKKRIARPIPLNPLDVIVPNQPVPHLKLPALNPLNRLHPPKSPRSLPTQIQKQGLTQV